MFPFGDDEGAVRALASDSLASVLGKTRGTPDWVRIIGGAFAPLTSFEAEDGEQGLDLETLLLVELALNAAHETPTPAQAEALAQYHSVEVEDVEKALKALTAREVVIEDAGDYRLNTPAASALRTHLECYAIMSHRMSREMFRSFMIPWATGQRLG